MGNNFASSTGNNAVSSTDNYSVSSIGINAVLPITNRREHRGPDTTWDSPYPGDRFWRLANDPGGTEIVRRGMPGLEDNDNSGLTRCLRCERNNERNENQLIRQTHSFIHTRFGGERVVGDDRHTDTE